MHTSLRYGDGEVVLNVPGARWVRTLQSAPVQTIEDLPGAFARAMEETCIGSPPLRRLIAPKDPVTIVVSDITRHWMRQDLICALLVPYLHDALGVPYAQIVILVALGTHRPQTEAELVQIVSPGVYEKVRVVNHDCDAADLLPVGETSRGTQVAVNPLVVGRKTILIGATVHHLMSGFGGGRKSILPGVCARATIYQNHLHALCPGEPRSNPAIGMGILAGNPLHEDMMEVAALVNPVFGINLVVRDGRHCALCCGHWQEAWLKSCEMVHAIFGCPIEEQADVVVAGCGGYPRDIDLYQGTKSLLNAAQAVRPGGTLVFLAECREGGGPPAFFGWLDSLRRGTLDADLRARFDVAGYIFYAACETLAKVRTVMLTDIPAAPLRDMGIEAVATAEALRPLLNFPDRTVYLMPAAGNTMPYLRKK